MRKGLVIWCMVVLPMMVVADDEWEPCLCADCPNPARGCMYTVHEGMVSRSFTLSGNVRVTKNIYDADILVYVTEGGADLVVSWVGDQPTNACGEWHRVEKNEDFSVCFVDNRCDASLVIRFGNAAKEYPPGVLPY